MASPAHAVPVSAHAMIHACCTVAPMKERVFGEAKQLGAAYIRVDVEMNAIFEGADGEKRATPNWAGLDEVMALSRKYDVPVLGILLAPPRLTSACPERPDPSPCPAAGTGEFGALAGVIAEHAKGTIGHWEIVNEPDGAWAFEGTPEQYARMLSAAYDGIKAKAPDDRVVLGGLMRPNDPSWLERVFATPGADALHKFDIANIHMRGPLDAVVRRYGEFKDRLARAGFTGPLWVTELGYPADPAYQSDPAYRGGDASQAAYLTQALVGLGELGAPQVFVTLHDGGLEFEYATEGLEHIDDAPEGDYPVTRRPAFAAVRRVVDGWDQLMAWRAEQREQEQDQRREQAKAALWRTDARTARDKFHAARRSVHAAQRSGIGGRIDRARALLAGTRTALLWKGAISRWHSQRAYEYAVAVELLKQRIAGD
jgi:hypothetical protein